MHAGDVLGCWKYFQQNMGKVEKTAGNFLAKCSKSVAGKCFKEIQKNFELIFEYLPDVQTGSFLVPIRKVTQIWPECLPVLTTLKKLLKVYNSFIKAYAHWRGLPRGRSLAWSATWLWSRIVVSRSCRLHVVQVPHIGAVIYAF